MGGDFVNGFDLPDLLILCCRVDSSFFSPCFDWLLFFLLFAGSFLAVLYDQMAHRNASFGPFFWLSSAPESRPSFDQRG